MQPKSVLDRMFDALSYADAGEYLGPRAKARVLAGSTVAGHERASTSADAKTAPQVGLLLGSELPETVLRYVTETCAQLHMGLTVLSFLDAGQAQRLLAPHAAALAAAGVAVRLIELTGEPPAGLIRGLRRHPEIAFLVINAEGYLGRQLLANAQNQGGLPVPVVAVTAYGQASEPAFAHYTKPRIA
ncbi:MAG: hypothetical protein NZ524_04320 [Thiobacillaceae bacterium]|uniref:hypothetical protein n=1 Tax=Tepidimonas sp. TaxID=2002775 RepID=UPI00298F0030|nr:hypothetical protein [Tepidimonas sp.]MCS6786249.1 hypothetical protein [Thiobacillaceae bacterium]MDW8337323.1 hypothetical protein [Tepidimonas sp.]